MEYPKALYKQGEQFNVADASEEETKRADGYDDWAADYERMSAPAPVEGEVKPERKKPGPKPKPSEGESPAPVEGAEE